MTGPRPRRFAHLTRQFTHGSIYVVELDNGVVKVGKSRNPATRMSTLSYECRRLFKSEFSRLHVGPDLASDRAVSNAEKALLARMAEVIAPIPGYAEFFSGVTFEDAKALVLEVSSEFQAEKCGFVDGEEVLSHAANSLACD